MIKEQHHRKTCGPLEDVFEELDVDGVGRTVTCEGAFAFIGKTRDQQADDELYASIVLIAAFVAESKLTQAENTVEQTRPLSGKSANKFLQLQFDVESARAEATSGHGARARAEIEKVIQTARSHRLKEVELEARLASAGVEKVLLRSSEVPRDLLTLEDAARRLGF